ncbi:hypothetical protein ACFPYI_18835 [Halomarina salina]|uniref:AI-2E family transporter n=1 Tax=Halomarina salina TaxID=1872699 RepID=A0ABD5RTB8_9EURY|nr:hypothetical protein [Halomarina salina]
MRLQRRQRFVFGHLTATCSAIILLAALGSLTLELVFVISLIAFLVLVELTAPIAVTPRWRSRLKWVIAAGLLVFAYLVIKRILEILPPGVI